MARVSRFRRLQAVLLLFAFLPLSALSVAPQAGAATMPTPSLAGVWKTEKGDYFDLLQDAGSATFDSQMLKDACDAGPRGFVMKGTSNGTYMEGTLLRCTPLDDKLSTDCGLERLWETPFSANFTTMEIEGAFEGQWYIWDTDSGGNYTNCTLDYYYQVSFTMTRVDCQLMNFDELGARYVTDPAKLADDVAKARAMEGGEKLQWTAENLAPGGLKEKAEAFRAGLVAWGYTGRINSAYRTQSYQGHFADMRRCGQELIDNLQSDPDLAPYLASSINALKAEVAEHTLKSELYTVAGYVIPVPFVCWREPLTLCPHVDARAVDMTIVPDDNNTLDWIGAMYGFCRPYREKDRPHWDYVGDYAFGVEKCGFLGRGPGEATITFKAQSPVNIKVADSYGNAVGFDNATGTVVNDLGSNGASYSGPGTEPQIIQIFSVNEGNYTLSGVGTGPGSYTLSASVSDIFGVEMDEVSSSGTAAAGAPIAPFQYWMREDYSPAFPLKLGRYTGTPGPNAITWEVDSAAGTYNATVEPAGISMVLSAPEGRVLVLKQAGAGGPTRVTVPASAADSSITVRADGVPLNFTRTAEGNWVVLVFDRPAGATFVTVEGVAGQGGGGIPPGGAPPPAPGGADATLLVLAVVAAGALGAGAFVALRKRKGKAP